MYLQQTTSSPTEPRTLYRIKVADESKEAVRGARVADVDLRSFRSDIVAAGSDPYVYNIFGDVPATIIAPAVLFDNVTVKHGEERNEKLPYYPPPPPPPGTAAAQWLPFVILLEQSDPRAEVVKLADTPS